MSSCCRLNVYVCVWPWPDGGYSYTNTGPTPNPTSIRRIDFYDEMRKRVVEIKVSDYDAMAPMHEVQTLLYALLFGRGWKPTRQFELVRP